MQPPHTRSRRPEAVRPAPASLEEPVPQIRPFRALRFDADVIGELGAVIAPPYDVIGADRQQRLLARHPQNAVRLDLPSDGAR